MSEKIFFEKAKPEHAKGIADLYKRVYNNKYSLLEFTNPETVTEIVKEPKYVWYVAISNDEIIGSAAAEIDFWNNSAEPGRGVVDKQYSGKGIATTLLFHIKNETLERGVDIMWSTARNLPIYKICKKTLEMEPVGYFPGAHLVEERETHLIMMNLLPAGKTKRIISPVDKLYHLPGVQKICRELDLKGIIDDYPKDIFVAAPSTKETVIKGFYNKREKSFTINKMEGENFESLEYLQATLLADKIDPINRLQHLGFSITAFLPAWYLQEGKRYDCVMMANPLAPHALNDVALQHDLEELMRGLEGGLK
ncbi:GNAT family N-acetyltransferase [Candidatus Woesearchaeota archaeon]|nr:GNAT family N-acetyltransferase [Candidatus Woesearchaeota archaeon]